MSADSKNREPARFTGVATYNDPKGRFHFRFPTDWHQFELDEDREGVIFAPDPEDPQTHFSAWVSKLEDRVVAEDVEVLREGVEEGLHQLAGLTAEEADEITLGNLVKFERIFTFDLDGRRFRRKTWIMYVDEWMIVLAWQAEADGDYEHWLPMANYAYATFNIPEELWFATDRDLGFGSADAAATPATGGDGGPAQM